MNPVDEKLPAHVATLVYTYPARPYPSLRAGYLGALVYPDNPRLLFRDPISPLLFL